MASRKSPELLALEQFLPMTVQLLSGGGAVDLRWFGGKLVESNLITSQAVDAALEKQGGVEKANQLMKAVVTQVTLDDACFAPFLNILESEDALKALGNKFTDAYKKLGGSTEDTQQLSRTPQTPNNSTVLAKFIQYLRCEYNSLSPIPHETEIWFPRCDYINLTLLEGEALKTSESFDITQTRQMELAMKKGRKVPLEVKDIFSKCKTPKDGRKLLVVEGIPGIGKSTLVLHICQKWGEKKLFSEFKWVIHVPLRDEAIRNASCLADIIPARSQEDATAFAKVVIESLGSGGLLIFDGWNGHSHHTNFLAELVRNPKRFGLSLCTFAVTTRPVAADELLCLATSHVEIMGFRIEEREEFIREALECYDRQLKELLENLKKHPLIFCTAYVPLVSAFLVDIVRTPGMSLPKTLHGVLVEIILCNVWCESTKSSPELDICIDNILTLDSLTECFPSIRYLFSSLCKLAYYGTQENRVVFYGDNLVKAGLTHVESTKLGLVQAVKQSTSRVEQAYSYSFIHLTVQETLAAYYASKMPDKEKVKTFRKMLGNPCFCNVLQMYAGLCKLRSKSIREVIASMVKKSKDETMLVSVLNSLYEAQDPSLCLYISGLLCGKLHLVSTSLSCEVCISIGYFLSCVLTAPTMGFEVSLPWCSLCAPHINLMMKELLSTKDIHLTMLNLRGNHIDVEGAISVSEMLSKCVKLEHLDLGLNGIGVDGAVALSEAIKGCPRLEVLMLTQDKNMHTGENKSKKWMNVKRTQMDGLDENNIGDVGAVALSETLRSCPHVRYLMICYNHISDRGKNELREATKTHSITVDGLEHQLPPY